MQGVGFFWNTGTNPYSCMTLTVYKVISERIYAHQNVGGLA